MRSASLVSLAALVIAAAALGCSSADVTIAPHKTTTSTPPAPSGTSTGVNDTGPAPPVVAPPATGTEIGSETWSGVKELPASITIKAGATVTVAPGTIVTAAAGVAITVKGTLSVTPGASHATLGGTNWKGLVIASGGALAADGLDITNAEIGIWTMAGNVDATLTNSAVVNAGTPFKMEPASKLSVSKSKVTATGPSAIAGTFTASYLDYDKASAEGLQLNDPAGSMTISDSTLHGVGGGDYVVSVAGKLVKVEYSTITGSHCGFHFGAVDQFIIDHVSDDQNSYGAMLYGSGAGPNQILSSNIRSTDKDLDMSGTNGVTTIDKSFTGGKNTLQANAKITNIATVAVANAKPR